MMDDRDKTRRRALLTALVVAALLLLCTGCVPMLFLTDSACYGSTVEDPLLEIHFTVLAEPLRYGEVLEPAAALHLYVGHGGEALMSYEPENRVWYHRRCRPLAADDLAEVIRAVERLEHSVVAERRIVHEGCRNSTRMVLRDDQLLKSFFYCGTTLPAEVVRFVQEISGPLGRRFGEELAACLASTAPWASPVPGDPTEGG